MPLVGPTASELPVKVKVTFDDIVMPTHCPVLGIPLGFSNSRDHVPSIDRIVNTKGYTKDNIVIVSLRANRFKSDATLEELKRLVAFYEGHFENHLPSTAQ